MTLATLTCRAALCLSLLAMPFVAAAHDVTAGALRIDHPWARPNLPDRPTAGYLVIENTGAEADRLLGASSPAFGTIELHSMTMDGDTMMMKRVEAIEAPAQGSVALEPGGFHMMLFDAAGLLKVGDTFPVTLEFERAGTVPVTINVEKGMEHSH
jgi:hypothetical protein